MEQFIEFIKQFFQKSFWWSSNFWLSILVVVITYLQTIGIDLTTLGLEELVESFFSGDPELVFVAALSVINSVWHLAGKTKAIEWLKEFINILFKRDLKES